MYSIIWALTIHAQEALSAIMLNAQLLPMEMEEERYKFSSLEYSLGKRGQSLISLFKSFLDYIYINYSNMI